MHAYERGDRRGHRRARRHPRASPRGWPRRSAAGDLARDRRAAERELAAAAARSTPACARRRWRGSSAAMRDAGVLGGKAAGSGAGGSMFFLGPRRSRPPRRAAARELGMRLLPVRWARDGRARMLTRGPSSRSGARHWSASADLARAGASDSPSGPRRCSSGRRRSPAPRRCSRRTAASVPSDGTALVFDPWSPRVASLSAVRRGVHRRAPRPRLGPLPAPLARASGRRDLAALAALGERRRRGRGARPRILAAYAEPLPRLPQPRQRARAQPAVLLHLSRVHLAHQLPRGGVAAAGGRRCSSRRSPRR